MKNVTRHLLIVSVMAIVLGGCSSTNRNGEAEASKPGGTVSDTELHSSSSSKAITGRGESSFEDRAPNYNGSSDQLGDREGEAFVESQAFEDPIGDVQTDATLSGTTDPFGETNQLESAEESRNLDRSDVFDENVVDSYSVDEPRELDTTEGTMSGMTESAVEEDEDEESVSGTTSSITDQEWSAKDKKSKKKKKKSKTRPTTPTDESTMDTDGSGAGY